jgi:uncharacterized lipoprotein YmbA
MTMNLERIGLVIALALAAGCGSSPAVRYYTLDAAEAPAAAAAPGKAELTVTVGPVSVPDAVDRPQIVLRVGANRVERSEFDRWGEALKLAIPRVVAASLGRELASAQVFVYSPSAPPADFRVLIDVERFESEPAKAVTVEASWSILPRAMGAPKAGRSVAREPVGAAGYDALVSAHSRALVAVSRDIAETIRSMSR